MIPLDEKLIILKHKKPCLLHDIVFLETRPHLTETSKILILFFKLHGSFLLAITATILPIFALLECHLDGSKIQTDDQNVKLGNYLFISRM